MLSTDFSGMLECGGEDPAGGKRGIVISLNSSIRQEIYFEYDAIRPAMQGNANQRGWVCEQMVL
jgi:hypothetical protein